jgi:tripartite-type tricarboxylate transporter receptor subunit TctC
MAGDQIPRVLTSPETEESGMKLPRRTFLHLAALHLAAGAVALPAMSRIARAQAYPTRPITLIVPFGAGGPVDVFARIVAESMSRSLGQQLVVENVVGAGGTTATTRTMRANPDGYTIQIGNTGTHATALAFYPNLAYRPESDFAPIGMIVLNAFFIVANKNLPPRDLAEFILYAKANSEKLNMGHGGVGSATHLAGLLLNASLGVKPAMVPFNGTAQAMAAMIGGHIDYMAGPTAEAIPQFQSGTIKVFAVASAERSNALRQIPTTREAGLPEFQVRTWNGLFAPKGTPKPILDKLTDALDQALDDDTTRNRIFDLGSEIPLKTERGQARLAALVKSEIARWTPIIKVTNK